LKDFEESSFDGFRGSATGFPVQTFLQVAASPEFAKLVKALVPAVLEELAASLLSNGPAAAEFVDAVVAVSLLRGASPSLRQNNRRRGGRSLAATGSTTRSLKRKRQCRCTSASSPRWPVLSRRRTEISPNERRRTSNPRKGSSTRYWAWSGRRARETRGSGSNS
jgi:hypothetical protein